MKTLKAYGYRGRHRVVSPFGAWLRRYLRGGLVVVAGLAVLLGVHLVGGAQRAEHGGSSVYVVTPSPVRLPQPGVVLATVAVTP